MRTDVGDFLSYLLEEEWKLKLASNSCSILEKSFFTNRENEASENERSYAIEVYPTWKTRLKKGDTFGPKEHRRK